MQSRLSASDLYSISQGGRNEGDQHCHWCGSPCRRIWPHDDTPPVPFVRTVTYARRPDQPWVCFGCWRWRWRRTTVRFISEGFKDGQCALNWSWLFTEGEALAVRLDRPSDREALYGRLLKPPLRFCLALLDCGGLSNHLQLALANDHPSGVEATTPLEYTINSIRHEYSVYDLERTLREGPQGKPPGAAALVKLLGDFKLGEKEDPQKAKVGRHGVFDTTKAVRKNVTVRSGAAG